MSIPTSNPIPPSIRCNCHTAFSEEWLSWFPLWLLSVYATPEQYSFAQFGVFIWWNHCMHFSVSYYSMLSLLDSLMFLYVALICGFSLLCNIPPLYDYTTIYLSILLLMAVISSLGKLWIMYISWYKKSTQFSMPLDNVKLFSKAVEPIYWYQQCARVFVPEHPWNTWYYRA